MSNISYNRTGIIKKVGEDAIMIEMADTGESIVWPLDENDEDSDISDTLEVGEEVSIQMHISDDPFHAETNEEDEEKELTAQSVPQEEDQEAERMRKMLEELLN